jgi:hypothetical protein
MFTTRTNCCRAGILSLVIFTASIKMARSQIDLLQTGSPVIDRAERGGPPDNITHEEWLAWYDARHRDADARASFLSIETQHQAEGLLPAGNRYYRNRVAQMVTEFNRRYAQLRERPPEPRQLARLLTDVVRWGLDGDNRECIGFSWFFYRLCDELGYRDGNQIRSYNWAPRYGGGHSFNRITLRNQVFVVDAYNDILIRP